MKSYRDFLNERGVAAGPWVVRERDSGSRPAGEDTRSVAECEARQSDGLARIAHPTSPQLGH